MRGTNQNARPRGRQASSSEPNPTTRKSENDQGNGSDPGADQNLTKQQQRIKRAWEKRAKRLTVSNTFTLIIIKALAGALNRFSVWAVGVHWTPVGLSQFPNLPGNNWDVNAYQTVQISPVDVRAIVKLTVDAALETQARSEAEAYNGPIQ
jgi:hypothetical protein